MPLNFHPQQGMVLYCDFTTGFRPPEMVKFRSVVIISPRPRHATQLCIVVPLSTTAPIHPQQYRHIVSAASLPGKFSAVQTWAKCDMIATVALGQAGPNKDGER